MDPHRALSGGDAGGADFGSYSPLSQELGAAPGHPGLVPERAGEASATLGDRARVSGTAQGDASSTGATLSGAVTSARSLTRVTSVGL